MSIARYTVNLGLPWRGEEDFRKCVLATDHDALIQEAREIIEHLSQSNHGYVPHGCSGCADAQAFLDKTKEST